MASGLCFRFLGGRWIRHLQFRTVGIAEIEAALSGLAQVLRQGLVQVDDRFDLGVQKGWLASEINPPKAGRDQTDVTVGMQLNGLQPSLEAIPLSQQRSDLVALLLVPASHPDVGDWLW